MVVLLIGSTGFLGQRLCTALIGAGHEVVRISRRPVVPASVTPGSQAASPRLRHLPGDLARDLHSSDWTPRLQGVDAVVNAAGILRESTAQSFERLHARGPIALFDACVLAGVRRVVQVSALGAEATAATPYLRSKHAADDHLLQLPLSGVVVQPSILVGTGGASTALFARLAALPLIPVPGSGLQQIQPLHVDDAVQAVMALLQADARTGRVPLVGPTPVALRDFLQMLRQSMHLPRAPIIGIPEVLVDAAAWTGSRRSAGLLDLATWRMLQQGNVGPSGPIQSLLGRRPRPAAALPGPGEGDALRTAAQLAWLLPLLRWSIAAVWLATAAVSALAWPVDASLQLLARTGVPASLAPALLWSATALDLAVGLATLLWHRWRALWMVQGALIALYTVIIAWRLPEFWAHPFGPILKNLPMLVVLVVLHQFSYRPAQGPPR